MYKKRVSETLPSNLSLYIKSVSVFLKDHESQNIEGLFEEMIKLEKKFVSAIRKAKMIKTVYLNLAKSINYGSTASISKTYFRIKYDTNVKTLHQHVAKLNLKDIQKYPINHKFCSYVINNFQNLPTNVHDIYKQINAIREKVIKQHLYFAIHQAKVYKSMATGTPIEFDDLIQIANTALISCIDTHVLGEESAKFHQRAMGVILGSLINFSASESPVYINQKDSRILYKIRKLLKENDGMTAEKMSVILDIAECEINDLMSVSTGAQSLNINLSESDSDYYCLQDVMEDTKSENPEEAVSQRIMDKKLQECYNKLSTLEKKILRLKGIRIHENS